MKEERISANLRKSKSRIKQRVTMEKGDIIIKAKELKYLIIQIQSLEDESYAYRNRRRYEK